MRNLWINIVHANRVVVKFCILGQWSKKTGWINKPARQIIRYFAVCKKLRPCPAISKNNKHMMENNIGIIIFSAVAGMYSCGAGGTDQAREEKPNILLILVDDLGLGDLSCQYATDMQTPHIDSLFTGGIRLDRFYANSTVSSPSRAGLLTGRYPDMVGVPGVIRTNPDASWGYLSPDAVLLPQVLGASGYRTALIGKWHLGLENPNLPNERGFDYFHGFLGDMMDDYYTHLRQGNNYMRLNGETIDPQGHATDLFTDWAVEYIERSGESDRPFFLYLAYNAPHLPLQPPREWESKVRAREAGISDKRGKLVALTEHLDHNVGRIMESLRRSGQLENTLVIFTSDNGGDRAAEACNGPVRGYKTDMYEGGIRVPCAVYWPGTFDPKRENGLVMMSDLFPTLCEAAGAACEHTMDGISVLPLLKGEEQDTENRILFWVRREHGDLGGKTQHAVRSGDYKLLQNRPFEALQLFNTAHDPLESNPLPLEGEHYAKLYRAMIEHYRLSGSTPWQKPLSE